MSSFRAYTVAAAASILFFVMITATANHFIMEERLSSLKARFDAIALDHLENGAPYAGRINKIIAERNKVLHNAHYFLFGTWDTESEGVDALYIKFSLLPDKSYLRLWGASGGSFETTVMMVSYFAPSLASLAASVFFFWLARNATRNFRPRR